MSLKLGRNSLLYGLVGLMAVFGLFVYLAQINAFIEVLNGMFIGMFVGVVLIYRTTIARAFSHNEDYDSVRVITIGMCFSWITRLIVCLAYSMRGLFDGNVDDDFNAYIIALTMYISLFSSFFQASAPLLMDGYIKPEIERKRIYRSTVVGGVVALGVIIYQRVSVP